MPHKNDVNGKPLPHKPLFTPGTGANVTEARERKPGEEPDPNAADPIVTENADTHHPTVQGIFVENKSGRQAVKAKVVVDATGEAYVARSAGDHGRYSKTSYN